MSARWPLLALLALFASSALAQAPADMVRVGDRILLHVEPGLTDSTRGQQSDTFTVNPGPELLLPGIGQLSLAGVRRAEVEPYLTRQLARFLRDPAVHARVLVRLAVLGEVARPGFYAIPADAVLTDAVMAAGGPTRDSKFTDVRIERDGARLWAGEALQRAMARGMTVDQMNLGAGDRIIVPRRHDATAAVQVLGILLALPAAIYGLTKLF